MEAREWTGSAAKNDGEREFDRALRPRRLAEFVGQARLRENLAIAIGAARSRDEPLDHLLFCGPPGLGKTTLAFLIAAEMGSEIVVSSGPALASPKDLAGTLSRLERGDVLFLDEIHRLPRAVEEFLYSAMEDQAIDITLDQGPAARTLRIHLAPFTLIGATTREGLLAAPFRSRFGIVERLLPYPVEELVAILERAATLLGFPIETDAAGEIARRSRGVPRIALRLQRRVRDLAQVRELEAIDLEIAREGLERLGVDALGLEDVDRAILEALVDRNGEPVGIKTLAACIGEEEDTLESVFEPYLMQLGFLSRTPRGRVATIRAWQHLGRTPPATLARDAGEAGAVQRRLPFENE
ncbi:MAG: Holliday junction branch migration DNA helicase RuvB [Planctomycetes bacterium]|nr:Holliday junction branch migration DNA helicase RuvB [Planctomycetota bacterium]MCB9891835.1 Holliday junction branch migration DNA helicase RuvB [Planctomycetota bacterium]MCB9918691.1 Holliday junction branch migration DNA helicase RuvB [Planctomycetota bacterium]